jgi:large exoprotein involved in heme utilization and adhesion
LGFTETGLQNVVFAETTGSTGEILLNAETLTVSSGAGIRTATLNTGNASDIIINTRNAVVSESGFIESVTLGEGNTGNIDFLGETLTLQGGTIALLTLGDGSVGNLTINMSNSVELIGFTTINSPSSLFIDSSPGQGNAGNLTVNTSRLVIREGASLFTSAGVGLVGDLTINASELIELSGTSTQQIDGVPVQLGSRINSLANESNNAGDIIITTGDLILRNGAGITADTIENSSGNAGNITIQASEIQISGEENPGSLDSLVSRLRVGAGGTGNAGTITIDAEKLTLEDGGQISAITLGSGQAGSINIHVTDIELRGGRSDGLLSSGLYAGVGSEATGSVGNTVTTDELIGGGGSIVIDTERLSIEEGAQINAATQGSGSAGSIEIQAAEIQLRGTDTASGINRSVITTQTAATGAGGDIIIATERLLIQDGAQITAGTSVPIEFDFETNEVMFSEDFNPERGAGGTIVVDASESVDLSGTSLRFSPLVSNISSQVAVGTNGTGGDVIVETGRLTVQKGAEISSSTLGIGDAGSVTIQAEAVELTGTTSDGQLSSNLSAAVGLEAVGTGGTVTVNTGLLEMSDRANITVSSQGIGDPGNLQVTASDISLDTQGRLSAESATGQGGNIDVNARDLRLFRASEISAIGSEDLPTFEGNIAIDADLLVLLQESRIVTDASSPSGGSNINIQPFNNSNIVIIQSNDSVINAAGNLTIDSSVTFQPAEIPEVAVTDPNDLIAAEFCRQRGESAFVVTGRGGIAVSPNDKADGNQIEVDLVEPVPSQPRNSSQKRSETEDNQPISSLDIIPARGWIRDENGDVILVSYDPTKTGVRRQPAQLPQCQP